MIINAASRFYPYYQKHLGNEENGFHDSGDKFRQCLLNTGRQGHNHLTLLFHKSGKVVDNALHQCHYKLQSTIGYLRQGVNNAFRSVANLNRRVDNNR